VSIKKGIIRKRFIFFQSTAKFKQTSILSKKKGKKRTFYCSFVLLFIISLNFNILRTVSDLQVGEKGKIKSFSDPKLALKLMEMGCLPGTEIELDSKAPLGCPYCLTIGKDYQLSLRKSEAQTILLHT
jgi:ferrous iron transport protein A